MGGGGGVLLQEGDERLYGEIFKVSGPLVIASHM